jgi:hypothetical protein
MLHSSVTHRRKPRTLLVFVLHKCVFALVEWPPLWRIAASFDQF